MRTLNHEDNMKACIFMYMATVVNPRDMQISVNETEGSENHLCSDWDLIRNTIYSI